MRCLDIGTYDGFYAFELEARGAAEVVAADVSDAAEWDWPADARKHGRELVLEITEARPGLGFEAAKAALGSSAERIDSTIYDLSPDTVGLFDVVVCGSLLLHLRDPVRALEAVRSVCRGHLLTINQVELGLELRNRHAPAFRLNGSGEEVQWWLPNRAGHAQLLHAAGFGVERATRPFALEFGPSHPSRGRGGGLRGLRRRLTQRVLAGGVGVPHNAILATPRL